DGYTAPLRRIRLAEAGHPVPDARGLAASARLLELAASAREDDLVLFLVSGGGSALAAAPAPPVMLEEKQHVTRLRLAAGATTAGAAFPPRCAGAAPRASPARWRRRRSPATGSSAA